MEDTERVVTITDRDGCSFCLTEVDGVFMNSPCTKEWRDATKAFIAKDDDVYITSYPKSGTHWVWEIVRMLIGGSADLPERNMFSNWIEMPHMTTEVFDQLPTPRILACHRYFHGLPRDAVSRGCKVVYVERYIKDCAVSFYNMYTTMKALNYDGSWPAYAELFLKGQVHFNSWFDYVKDWRRVLQEKPDYPIHRLRYEDLKKDTAGEIAKLAKFLEVPADEELIDNIVHKTVFASMKSRKDESSKELDAFFKGGKSMMYRKGEVGDWKNWFTVAQSEEWDAEYFRQMGRQHSGQDDY